MKEGPTQIPCMGSRRWCAGDLVSTTAPNDPALRVMHGEALVPAQRHNPDLVLSTSGFPT